MSWKGRNRWSISCGEGPPRRQRRDGLHYNPRPEYHSPLDFSRDETVGDARYTRTPVPFNRGAEQTELALGEDRKGGSQLGFAILKQPQPTP